MKFGRIGKAAWYLCGVILVLSLPTFSYLVPKTELVMGPGVDRPVHQPQSRTAPLAATKPQPAAPYVLGSRPSSFISFGNGQTRSVPLLPSLSQPRPRPMRGGPANIAESDSRPAPWTGSSGGLRR